MKIENYSDMHFNSNVAKKYSIMAAMVLNRILWSLTFHQNDPDEYGRYFIDEKWWMKNTYVALANYFDGLVTQRTIQEIILKFERDGYLISRRMTAKSWSQEKWYSVDSEKIKSLLAGGETPEKAKKPMIMHDAKNVSCTESHDTGRDIIDDEGRDIIDDEAGASSSLLKSRPKSPTKTSQLSLAPKAKKSRAIAFEEEDLKLGEEWLDFAIKEKRGRPYASWTAENFAKILAKIRASTDLNHEGIRAVFEFVQENDFWRSNAISPAGLMTRSRNDLLKIDNLITAMKGSPKYRTMRTMEKIMDIEFDPAAVPF